MYCFIPNAEYKFIYCPIPKVANTSFRQLIFKLDGIENKFYQKENWIYAQNNLSLFSFNYLDAIKILNVKNYFKFAFVRNPWSRLVSAYLDKFVKTSDPSLKSYYNSVIKNIY